MTLREGKLPPELLAELVAHTSSGPDILVGAAVGEDAAVVRGHDRLVVTSDPITFTEEEIGTYVVAVNANDIVAMGGIPRYLSTTILVPPGTHFAAVRSVFERIGEASRRLGLLWIGGHTEVTPAVTRLVVSGNAIGTLERPPLRTNGARAGDRLVLTKWAALEGTTLVARERPKLCRELLGEVAYRRVLAWLTEPGISIAREGRITAGCAITAAHDPTEGGVVTGIREIALSSGLAVSVERDSIAVRPETALVCRSLGLDPLGLVSSGCFLFSAAEAEARRACRLLEQEGIPAAVIGIMGEPGGALTMRDAAGEHPLPHFERDELCRLDERPEGRG